MVHQVARGTILNLFIFAVYQKLSAWCLLVSEWHVSKFWDNDRCCTFARRVDLEIQIFFFMHACMYIFSTFSTFWSRYISQMTSNFFCFWKIITIKLNWLSSTYSIGRTVPYEVPMFSTPVTYIALWHWYTWCIRTTPFHIPVKIETG